MDRVVVAYLDEPPFCFPGPDGIPGGADMEVARRVLNDARASGIGYVLTTFPELIPGLLDGRWQMTTAMFITPERSEVIAYSQPIWAAPDGFIVRADDANLFTSYEAIAAEPAAVLAVVTDQVQQQTALHAGVPPQRIIEFPDQDTAAEAVRRGEAAASASTAIGNHAYLQRAADPALAAVADQPVASRGAVPLGGFAFAKTTPELVAVVDDALDAYLGSPDHLAVMGRHGFTNDEVGPVL